MKFIQSSELPAPAGHYSQAVAAGGLVFLSGILPLRDAVAADASFEAQCESVFAQCEQVLRAVVPVPALHYGFLVEIALVAERR
jgi:2-iminobutanoate/2-iminopropanoate deaminase